MQHKEKAQKPPRSSHEGPLPVLFQEGGGQRSPDTHGDGGQRNTSNFRAFLRVFRYNDRNGVFMNVIAMIAVVASGTLLPIMDIIFGQFVNIFADFAAGVLSPSQYRDKVAKYSLYFVYLFIAKVTTSYIWMVLLSVTGIRTTKALRVDFVRSTMRQDISFFDSPSSSISGQITTNGSLVNNGISEKLGLTVQAITTFITAFVIAFAYQWKLTLIILSIVPLNLVVTIVCVMVDTIYERRIFDIYSHSSFLAEEAFSTIRTVHAFWAFPKLSKRFTDIIDEAFKVGSKKSLVYAILFPIEFFCTFAGYALAFWQGIRMYARGEIDEPGTVVTVVFAVLVAAQALTQVAPQTIAISKCAAAAQELFEMIDRQSSIDALSQDGMKIDGFRGEIRLNNVWFSYPSRAHVPVLRGLSLDIPAGQTTALVGTSGSGKSTIFGLLERWYSFKEGDITLDGNRVEDLNLSWLRTNVRLVQQEPTLFSGTILQNVADGLEGSGMPKLSETETQERVIDACKASYAHEFIEALPDGYNTRIGERGASLSGGQKQRIVIARSIISNPRVIMLDEATSALDPKSEKIVQQALENISKGRTVVTIAHRLSTVRNADKIVVLSQGQLVEEGSHDELMDLKGTYSRLVKSQDLSTKATATADDDGSGPEDSSDTVNSGDELGPVLSSNSTQISQTIGVNQDTPYGLLLSLWLVVREQRSIWAIMGIVCMAAIAAGGSYPALAILFAHTMNAFQSVDVKKGDFFSLMFFVVALAQLVLYSVAGWFSNVIGQHVMKRYRVELFEATLSQDVAFFDDPANGSGALVSRLAAETTSLQELFSMNLILIMANIVNAMSSSILAIVIGWKLGLALSLGALPAIVIAGYIRIRIESKLEEEATGRFARSSSFASQAILGIRTISSLALESTIIDRYQASLQSLAKDSIAGLGLKMVFYALSQSIPFLGMALGFWYGGRLVSTGEYNNQQFYTIFTGVIFSGEASAMLFQYSTSISNAKTAVNYILRLRRTLLRMDPTKSYVRPAPDIPASHDASCDGHCINFENVQFAYPTRRQLKVLKGIDISIESNTRVAFVGPSGCGKSTMVSLLERFYDPITGTIRTDGHNIKEMNCCLYRKDIALVQQEPVLYQGSIYENITLGVDDENASEDIVADACSQAYIWDFISSLPEGLNTPCGSQGLSLSGGQRQRIAIARALIRRPRLLLLDEATSALDTESERIVKEALDNAATGRTTIAIAHRLSTIKDSDLIVVFSGGKVVEQGTHESLVAARGIYYEMVLGQSLDREA